ncbi:hypothetical protein SERLA73DRAFT_154568 [Serpula lacrymans var. lacrymans S7.3]|uniref:Uncharacterized protein n=1 Tax=Serpula lacrymans var. lacrymans (strain S7.3) TaxID=936435 RepID=F8Q6B4_SERL3|nr:hypothetical protein SERLA73DRAFT_154568 [Serpula lacrymans var. lacrymans S7.3]
MQMNVIGYIHDMDLFTVGEEYLRLKPIGYGTTRVLREWLAKTAFPQGVWSERDDVVKTFANNFSFGCEVNDGHKYLQAGEKPFAYKEEDLIEGDLVMLHVMQRWFPLIPQDIFEIDRVNWEAFHSVRWKTCNWRTFLELKEVALLREAIDRCRTFFQ